MLRIHHVVFASFLSVCFFLPGASDAKDASGDSVSLWDTVKHSDASLSREAVAARDGWKEIADEKATFEGDACLANSRLALMLRKGCKGAEWYYNLDGKLVKGPTLIPVGADGDKAKAMQSFRLLDHTQDTFLLEAVSTTESGKTIAERYSLKKGKPFVETAPGEGTEKVQVEMRSGHAVIPDLFGADVVVTARAAPRAGAAVQEAAQLRLPSENILLNFIDNGNAIVQCVWRSGDQDVRISLDGAGEERAISSTEIAYKKDLDMHVWVGVLAAPAIWCQKKAGELDPVKFTKLDWQIPFRALWRADYRRTDGLIDSWKLVLKKEKEGEWEAFGVSLKKEGTVWHPTRGTFGYPAKIDHDAAWLRITKFGGWEMDPHYLKPFKYQPDAAIVIYPFQKTGASPKDAYGMLDVVKEALEDTPEFTLPDDMQVKTFPRGRYPGVCGTTGEVEKIFDAREEQKKKREIIERFYKMCFFNVVVRMRIQEYMAWSKRTRDLCAAQKAANPQLAPLADEMDGILSGFDRAYSDLKMAERTPAASHILVDKFIALVDNDGSEDKKNEEAKLVGRDTRTIASNQDHCSGVCRALTKVLRQRAAYRMIEAKDPASFDFARDLRQRSLEMLKNTIGVEGGFTD